MTPGEHASVRMYNVGFGDCFLVTLPHADGPRRILFDCGTHVAGPGPRPIAEVVAQVIADAGGRIDVVVATHRHADHVSGFQQKAWRDVEVGEVWMPWTEVPDDPAARDIRERQSRAARKLLAALQLRAEPDPLAMGLAENALTNAKAMETLHRGFSGGARRRFLPPEGDPATFETPLLPGVRVHVLGPSRVADVIRDMDPPPGAGYLELTGLDGDGDGTADVDPFLASWGIPVEQFERHDAFEHLVVDQRDRDYLRRMGEADLFGLAVALEKAVNGTSLVLALEVGEALLLFPGDAQWGTWKAILDRPEDRALLERTTFWKVGHHGSHNATPRAFVESLAADRDHVGDLWSMVSTRKVAVWPAIPKPELVDAVEGLHAHFARSDLGEGSDDDGFEHYDDHVVEALVPLRHGDG
jgi:hypothetical protein